MTQDQKQILIGEHPDNEDLGAFSEGVISPWLRSQILEHIETCDKCRFVATELARNCDLVNDLEMPGIEIKPLKLDVVKKQQGDVDSDSDESSSVRPWRRAGDTFYFWIAGSCFFLSLLIPRYNANFLIAAAFFGLLAVIDYSHRNIFAPLIKAWREGDDEKAEQVIEELRNRFKIG